MVVSNGSANIFWLPSCVQIVGVGVTGKYWGYPLVLVNINSLFRSV